MTDNIVTIADFVHDYLLKTGGKDLETGWGPKYRWEHTQRVGCWAQRLANEERADEEKCVIAALFHDVSHFICEDYRKHGIKSAEIARDYLQKNAYDKDLIEDVAYAVETHVAEPNPKTLEAKILQDADSLDRFGYFRILLFGKKAEVSNFENLRKEVNSSLASLDRLERGEFGPMWTTTGKAKLKELINLNKTLLRGILEELENTKTPLTS
jgi:uncharacterized protein